VLLNARALPPGQLAQALDLLHEKRDSNLHGPRPRRTSRVAHGAPRPGSARRAARLPRWPLPTSSLSSTGITSARSLPSRPSSPASSRRRPASALAAASSTVERDDLGAWPTRRIGAQNGQASGAASSTAVLRSRRLAVLIPQRQQGDVIASGCGVGTAATTFAGAMPRTTVPSAMRPWHRPSLGRATHVIRKMATIPVGARVTSSYSRTISTSPLTKPWSRRTLKGLPSTSWAKPGLHSVTSYRLPVVLMINRLRKLIIDSQ